MRSKCIALNVARIVAYSRNDLSFSAALTSRVLCDQTTRTTLDSRRLLWVVLMLLMLLLMLRLRGAAPAHRNGRKPPGSNGEPAEAVRYNSEYRLDWS